MTRHFTNWPHSHPSTQVGPAAVVAVEAPHDLPGSRRFLVRMPVLGLD